MELIYHPNVDVFSFKGFTDMYFAQCISADAAMGKGIAVKFVELFPEVKALRSLPPFNIGATVQAGNVFNLITKKCYWQKPTYDTFALCLGTWKTLCMDIRTPISVAMPKIGCGLDRLKWDQVELLLTTYFSDIDIQFHICYFDNYKNIP